MNRFKVCYPDANNFNRVIKVKKLDDWNTQFVPLEKNIGYWIAEQPFYDDGFELFKNVVSSFPIQKDNSHPDNFDPNPFDTIHLPDWATMNVCFLLRDFYFKHITDKVYDPQIHEWGNLYFKDRSRPIKCWRMPHIDYVHGIVANLWFTDHDLTDSSTKLYYYTGKMRNDIYDFQVDQDHPMHKEWRALSEFPTRLDSWYNPPEDEMRRWGFELVGETPTKAGTMTMYQSNISHNPFISENVDFRWSHAFAFSHEAPDQLYIRDIFK